MKSVAVILLTDRQTHRQTRKPRRVHNLSAGFSTTKRYINRHYLSIYLSNLLQLPLAEVNQKLNG